MEVRLSINKQIRQRGEGIIDDTEEVMKKLQDLEVFAKEKRRPYMHFYALRNDLKTFINHFERLLR
ncbi:hypothetical protein D4R42_02655 [bacterium]|nr:MAG: hypothetical protein D4R42_02655 [bacterium]